MDIQYISLVFLLTLKRSSKHLFYISQQTCLFSDFHLEPSPVIESFSFPRLCENNQGSRSSLDLFPSPSWFSELGHRRAVKAWLHQKKMCWGANQPETSQFTCLILVSPGCTSQGVLLLKTSTAQD